MSNIPNDYQRAGGPMPGVIPGDLPNTRLPNTPVVSEDALRRLMIAAPASPPPKFTAVNEQNRTYHFPNGSVTLTGVVGINVSKSGTHRINTKDGKKHIIPPGWIHIEFDAPNWTF